jgi:DNA-binding MarR family transcriptional regulator
MVDDRWLTVEQQRSWRAWLAVSALLPDRLEHELKSAHDLSLAEYEILVRLSEEPERRLRMSELASRTLASKSRLSHQVSRMEASGLVSRAGCLEDGRGSYAQLTDHGWRVLVTAAPCHVAGVRRWLVDALPAEDFARLGSIMAVVVEHLATAESPTVGHSG